MILDELAAFARKRVAADRAKTPLADIKAQAEAMPNGDFRFEKALAGKDCAFICEVKKASPSKGVIDPVFDFEAIARSYEDAGADCVSWSGPSRTGSSARTRSLKRFERSSPVR